MTSVTDTPARSGVRSTARILVWDPLVRIFHWSLLAAVAGAGITGFVLDAPWLDVHIWSGAAVGLLIAIRLIWGLLGGTYARFGGFITGPRALFTYLRALAKGTAPRHLGHNPAGGAMVLGLLGLLLALVISGVIVLGGMFKTGPLAFWLSYDTAHDLAELHEGLAIALLVLIALHVAGAIFESWREAENLPRAMLTGRKVRRPGDRLPSATAARPMLAAGLAAAMIGAAIWGGLTLAARPGYGVPAPIPNAAYRRECGECHMAFAPSLLRREAWVMLMARLDAHFGEDASLDPATAAGITDWLSANASETADTRPAHVFARTDPAQPFSLTASRFWKRKHRDIDASVFAAAPVYSRVNCLACHSDAETGLFYPGNIAIPRMTIPAKETTE
ncbi:MAG: cytochrome b/b6 domain-containing protein [Rhodobacteraceae bacterium]|nr:cytochrome b/b6 domain-containing protein [Paracoccaceae bacterium]